MLLLIIVFGGISMVKYLVPDSESIVEFGDDVSLRICKKIIPDNAVASKTIADWCVKGSPMKPKRLLSSNGLPRGIVVHNTEPISVRPTTTEAEQYTRATYPNCNMNGVVVHYYTDAQCAWQNLKLNEQGWHAADGSSRRSGHSGASFKTLGGNVDCLAVEIVGPESEDNGAKLVAYLMYMFNLNINDVYSHNYFMYGIDKKKSGVRKNCPFYILDHWDAFLKKVSKYYEMLSDKVKSDLKAELDSESMYAVQYGHFSSREEAQSYLKICRSRINKDAFLTVSTIGQDTEYRIQLGVFGDDKNAKIYCDNCIRKGITAYIVIK